MSGPAHSERERQPEHQPSAGRSLKPLTVAVAPWSDPRAALRAVLDLDAKHDVDKSYTPAGVPAAQRHPHLAPGRSRAAGKPPPRCSGGPCRSNARGEAPHQQLSAANERGARSSELCPAHPRPLAPQGHTHHVIVPRQMLGTVRSDDPSLANFSGIAVAGGEQGPGAYPYVATPLLQWTVAMQRP